MTDPRLMLGKGRHDAERDAENGEQSSKHLEHGTPSDFPHSGPCSIAPARAIHDSRIRYRRTARSGTSSCTNSLDHPCDRRARRPRIPAPEVDSLVRLLAVNRPSTLENSMG